MQPPKRCLLSNTLTPHRCQASPLEAKQKSPNDQQTSYDLVCEYTIIWHQVKWVSPRPYGWKYWKVACDILQMRLQVYCFGPTDAHHGRVIYHSKVMFLPPPVIHHHQAATYPDFWGKNKQAKHSHGIYSYHASSRRHKASRKATPVSHIFWRILHSLQTNFSLFFSSKHGGKIHSQGHCPQIRIFVLAGQIQETFSDLRIIHFVYAFLHNIK